MFTSINKNTTSMLSEIHLITFVALVITNDDLDNLFGQFRKDLPVKFGLLIMTATPIF